MSTLSFRAKLGPRSARSVTLASALVAGLGVATARAQSVELPEISVYANQAPTEVSKVGAATTVLRGADLRAQGYSNVPDALRTVPGVEVSQTGSHGSDANAGVIAITTISGRGQKPSADVKIEGGMERSREIAVSARGSSGPFYASVSADREATAGYNISRFDDFDNWSRRTNFNAR